MKYETNFGDLPDEFSSYKNASIVIVPVPYDGTSTWIKGADRGPEAILEASANMELYDIETDCEVYRRGIFTGPPIEQSSSPEQMVAAVKEEVAGHIARGKFAVTIGGEHSVSIGAIEAFSEAYGEITVLQLDAHSDLRSEYEGSSCNHACVMARAGEVARTVQVGIRSMCVEEKASLKKEDVFFAEDTRRDNGWIAKVLSRICGKVYITIDLDVFDPSIMPSTGTPEPGGLLWYETIELLKKVVEKFEVVGFDIVELCPNDSNKGPNFLAAKLIYKLLSYKFGA